MSSMKIDKFLVREELPQFFRDLADALEQGGEGELSCAADFKKFKVSVRDEYGQVSLRLKMRSASECTPDLGEAEDDAAPRILGKPHYSDLKMRMANSFKVIFKMIHQGQVPPREAVEEFLEDSALMVTYPGYGDPYYAMFTEACERFRAAYGSGDINALNKTVDELVHQKGHCHAKYK